MDQSTNFRNESVSADPLEVKLVTNLIPNAAYPVVEGRHCRCDGPRPCELATRRLHVGSKTCRTDRLKREEKAILSTEHRIYPHSAIGYYRVNFPRTPTLLENNTLHTISKFKILSIYKIRFTRVCRSWACDQHEDVPSLPMGTVQPAI